MRLLRRLRPSPAMGVACLALLFALAGTGVAAYQALPRNSVGTLQLKDNAVTSAKVRDRSLRAIDFGLGQIPAGPQGPAGAQGPAGPAGPPGPAGTASIKWAAVRTDGGIAAQSGGITLAAKPGAGQYLLNFGSSTQGKLILTSSSYVGGDTGNRGETSAGTCAGPPEGITCTSAPGANNVFVQTRSSAGVLEDHSYYIAVIG